MAVSNVSNTNYSSSILKSMGIYPQRLSYFSPRVSMSLSQMGFLTRLIIKLVANGVLLYVVTQYFPGFILEGGIETLAVGALLLTLLNIFLRPILTLLATPFIWLTLGLFNIVIHMAILWIADTLLASLAITNLSTLFWVSIIIAIINSII